MMHSNGEDRLGHHVNGVTIDAHPIDQAIIVKYRLRASSATTSSRINDGKDDSSVQKVIHLKDMNDQVDIGSLASLIMDKCSLIPEESRQELEQVLHYLQKRISNGITNGRARSASALSDTIPLPAICAEMEKVEEYIELLYEDVNEKNKGVLSILELSKCNNNLIVLIENETLIGALARVFREDWKKNFDLATNIMKIFYYFSLFRQFQPTLTHHKIGALCIGALEHELKRGESWAKEAKQSGEISATKWNNAIRKQHTLMTVCIKVLINIAYDLNVEMKMVRRDVLPLLLKCTEHSDSIPLMTSSLEFLLKLSIFSENKLLMDQSNLLDRILRLYPIEDMDLRNICTRLLFNLSFDCRLRTKMVTAGIVTHIAPHIESDSKAVNLLYQLSINDDAKAIITYTDAIQLLMSDLLTGTGGDVTRAILINAMVEKRNAQLLCQPNGEGLDLLMDLCLNGRDLLVAKAIRNIAPHDGPTQEMFLKWMELLIGAAMKDCDSNDQEKATIGFECFAIAAQITVADWAKLCRSTSLVDWMGKVLKSKEACKVPLQLQIVIACGTMSRHLEAAKALIPLLDTFLQLLQSQQEDDELVVQLLYVFLQLLRHRELAERLMGEQSALGSFIIDLMHDKNASIRHMCEKALLIIGEHSQEWARRIAGERFRFHNQQWLEMVEGGGDLDDGQLEDDYGNLIYDDQYDDGFDLTAEENLF